MTSSSASSCCSFAAVTTAADETTAKHSRFSIGSTVRVCVPTPIHSTATATASNGDSLNITISRRAIVATLSHPNPNLNPDPDDDTGREIHTLSLVLDDLAPRPLVRGASPFLIAPLFRSRGRAVEDLECRVEDVGALLPFELEEGFGSSGNSSSDCGGSGSSSGAGKSDVMETSSSSSFQLRQLALLRKSHGDELFRLKDYSSAIGYYEAALGVLSAKSRLAVGASCIARRKGRAAVAEVDCVEREEGEPEEEATMVDCARRIRQKTVKYDVTYLDEEGMPEEEDCISEKDVILAIWDDDAKEEQQEMEIDQHARFLQIRILLNLSRSLLRLASVDRTRGSGSCFGDRPLSSSHSSPSPSNRRDKYLSSAIVGCTAAISLCRYHRQHRRPHVPETLLSESISLEETALWIRANAHFERGIDQFPKAMRDARRIVEAEGPSLSHPDRPRHRRHAVELMNQIECAKRHRRRLDKKLSRDVCRWVQTSMDKHDAAHKTGRADDDDEEEEFSRSSDGNTSSEIHGGSNDDTVRTSGTDSVSASDDSGGMGMGSGIHSVDHNDHENDNNEDDDSLERWDRPSDSISGRRKHILPSRDDGRHSCHGDRSGNFFWVSKRRIDVDVVGVLAFVVAMWIVYSQ